jgi:hypothetical protein
LHPTGEEVSVAEGRRQAWDAFTFYTVATTAIGLEQLSTNLNSFAVLGVGLLDHTVFLIESDEDDDQNGYRNQD